MGNNIIKNEKGIVKISVRNLVEFILREGDIDHRRNRGASAEAMQAGSRIHRKIQKQMGSNYHAEVPLKIVIDQGEYQLIVEGRADGILIEREEEPLSFADNYSRLKTDESIKVTIDEIKGVYQNLEYLTEPVGVHRAQAMCYACIYAIQHDIKQINIQMTYCNIDTEDIRYFHECFSCEELEDWFFGLIAEYKKWADFQFAWRKVRQDSIKKLVFPYEYRKGQKELATGVYRTIHRKKTLFIQAPTGVGKTISTVFPAVKAVGEELGDKIFYLTAKTVTGTVAREAFELLREQGYRAKTLQITAKEKLCVCDVVDCNPIHCACAKGHFDRINDAVFQLLQEKDVFTREVILGQAKKHSVCPFEMCLDVAVWTDNIICDYNYVFDPNVCLKRFFAEGTRGDYIFLVDEAHNLVERSREMYSAEIFKEDFLAAKRMVRKYEPGFAKLFEKCNRILLDYKRECQKYVIYDSIANLMFAVVRLLENLDVFLQNMPEFQERKEVTEFYLNLRNFRNIYDLVDERYIIYAEHSEDERFKLKLYCVDPSKNLQERIDKGNAAIFFSATFLPIQYYKSLLSTKKDNYAVYARTAFSQEQWMLLIGKDVSSRYTRRNETEFLRIAEYILRTVRAKKGNYMVFFPSYKMMEQVYELFCGKPEVKLQNSLPVKQETAGDGLPNENVMNYPDADGKNKITCIMQRSGMKEEDRESFLQMFSEEETEKRTGPLAAFCVLGGIFGEGIDLKREQLVGAIIVGTGLPQISNEREILMQYYDRRSGEGFDYAYRYPGMNKVLQAAGRVIRTVEDIGVIELLDERFLHSDYRRLFPREWEQPKVCDVNSVGNYLGEFWRKQQEKVYK